MEIDRDDMTNNVLHGCLTGFVCMVAATFLVYWVLARIVPDPSANAERVIQLLIWLIGLGIGGYIAARRTNMTGFRTSLNVGLLALLFVLARLPEQPNGGYAEAFLAVVRNPADNWRYVAAMVLTVPAALLGGWIAERRGNRTPEGKAA